MAKKLPESAWRVPGVDKPLAVVAVKAARGEMPEGVEAFYRGEAARTQQELTDRGWGLWRCSALNGEVIVVVRDELVTGYPPGYPVYTVQELIELAREGVGVEAIRLAHEAKKGLGAKIQEVQHVQV